MKYVRATAEAANGRCPWSSPPPSQQGEPSGTPSRLNTDVLKRVLAVATPVLVGLLSGASGGGIQAIALKLVINAVVRLVAEQATEGDMSADVWQKAVSTIRCVLPASISSYLND
jgi:hypothetical protein